MLIISDSCEAVTLFKDLKVPKIFAVGSSLIDEKSFSDKDDFELGLSTNDKLVFDNEYNLCRFSFITYEFLKKDFQINPKVDMQSLLNKYDPVYLNGHHGVENTMNRKASQINVADFFKAKRNGYMKFSNEDWKLNEF